MPITPRYYSHSEPANIHGYSMFWCAGMSQSQWHQILCVALAKYCGDSGPTQYPWALNSAVCWDESMAMVPKYYRGSWASEYPWTLNILVCWAEATAMETKYCGSSWPSRYLWALNILVCWSEPTAMETKYYGSFWAKAMSIGVQYCNWVG